MSKQKILAILIFVAIMIFTLGTGEIGDVYAQAGAPYEVLAEINFLRAANGMGVLSENQYLTIAAQNHANWIAAGNPGGHTGAGGSSAQDRAIAVGYGGGASVRVTENWARGPGLTASGVVYTIWGLSAPHTANMLTTWHNEFGAGVALDGSGMTVYVVKFGHVAGSVPPPRPTADPDSPVNTPGPIIHRVATVGPNPDGSVVHVVKYGHTLWGIVDAYGIEMADLLALNKMTEDSAIFPDQELLIIPSNVDIIEAAPDLQEENPRTPQATKQPTATATPTPTQTATAPAAINQDVLTATPTEIPNSGGNLVVNIFSGDSRMVGFGLVAVSLFGIVLLFFTSARLK